MRLLAGLINTIRSQFKFDHMPRIYVTLGPLGSIGFDGQSNNIIFVSAYSGKESIYDTTGCGDAFCATITLLEWTKLQNLEAEIVEFYEGGNPKVHSLEYAQEMEYFMAVANAVAYCKATNPAGRVDRNKLMDLLDHQHLASGFNANIQDLLDGKKDHYPDWIDGNTHRLKHPRTARQIRVSDTLGKLISGN